MILTGKKIVVLGAGRSGRAAVALACSKGADVSVYDANIDADFSRFDKGAECHAGATEELGRGVVSDLLVISPGIDTYGEFVKAFSENTGECIGETELAARFYKGKIVAITGTNGKTTTTELIERILIHAGMSCLACGNYGLPFSEVLLMPRIPEAVALELSSFQLETVKEFHANVAIWLNFSADHMDRYKELDDYHRAKLNIFINQNSLDTAIVRYGEEVGDLIAQRYTFASEGENSDFNLRGDAIVARGEEILDVQTTRMRGLHNAENMMAAMSACRALGVSFDVSAEALVNFAPPMHRCELIRTLDGVEYLNDSKATNLHALDSALRSQSRPVILIAGGKDKGLAYDELLGRLEEKVRSVIVFGEIAESLQKEFSKVVPSISVETLEQAVAQAQVLATTGETVLLSPGTSSFDQFSGYEARGDHFRELVLDLK